MPGRNGTDQTLWDSLTRLIRKRFAEGSERSIRAKRNIVGLFLLRGVTVAVNFLLVPLTLRYLNPSRYGVWLTLTSIVGWVSILDIGIGNGLRNKLAEALAHDDRPLGRTFVSTTYAFVTLIAGSAIILFLLLNIFIPWHRVLNTPAAMEPELRALGGWVITFFLLRLVFGLIGMILYADQRPAAATMIEVTVSLCSLAAVFVLTKTVESSLFWLGFAISALMAIVPLAANFWFFTGRYRDLAPSIHHIDMRYRRSLMSLGVQFFLLQIAGVVVFTSANIVITQLYGPAEVTPFNIAFRYYGVAATVFTIILTPFWSAFTDAYARGDLQWTRMSVGKLRNAWLLLVGALVVMTAIADPVYAIWVGKDVQIAPALSVGMALYVAVVAWSNIFAYFMNGTGKIRLQVWVSLAVAVAVIPVALFLAATLGMRSAGVIFAITICLLPGCVIWPLQMKKLLEGRADGIWAR